MNTSPSLIYKEIRKAINTGEIANLPKAKLAEFSAALARSNAYTFFNVHEFPRINETVNTLLLAKSNEEVLSKVPTPTASPPAEIPDKKKDWHEKPLGKIWLTVAGGVILVLATYLLKQALGF